MRAPRWEWRGAPVGSYAGSDTRAYTGISLAAVLEGQPKPQNGTGECKQHGPGFWFKKSGKTTWKCAKCTARSA